MTGKQKHLKLGLGRPAVILEKGVTGGWRCQGLDGGEGQDAAGLQRTP